MVEKIIIKNQSVAKKLKNFGKNFQPPGIYLKQEKMKIFNFFEGIFRFPGVLPHVEGKQKIKIRWGKLLSGILQ